ncbi:S-adenosyl-L-methionine-dependent methyltransferase [Byssothecium circinans]|uniref:S-adenosyl-L-methionine-dependent methyltransferase n=1 Tax=Byssothecium circinans TaxID=147558 RepID=A0A6A5TM40_9PLEO|nr:S-adenosyl-L-methionine-dependent methyltransferase [Byssothecium circinans]
MSAAAPSEGGPSQTAPSPPPQTASASASASAEPPTSTTSTTTAPEAAPAPAPAPAPATESSPQATETPPQPQTDTQADHNDSVLNLEADTAEATDDDNDSAFEGHSTASTSLASSVMHYEYSNGRRYHGYRSGTYLLPNDDEEQDRLDFVHHIFLLMLDGKLYNAPLQNPRRVLDIGTGTGIWAIDFGDAHPGAEVFGTDLSPIQPSWVPPNVKFYIDDLESDWVYAPEEHFDYIHVREMVGAVADWDRLCAQSYANLNPGGYLELQEPIARFECDDGSLTQDTDLYQWQELCNEASKKFGKEVQTAGLLKSQVLNAGFVDVHEKIVKVPIGPWPKDPKMKELGRYHREQLSQGIGPYTLGFLGKVQGWSEAECKIITAKVQTQMRNPKIHTYIKYFFVHGRKPDNAVH